MEVVDLSKTVVEVLGYVFGMDGARASALAYPTEADARTANASEMLAGWVGESARFERFVEANRDKIRKKLRSARDAEAYRDVLAELAVARRLVDDRRTEVTYEPLAAASGGGPDFGVRFRVNTLFYVEVTRPRGGVGSAQRLAAALCTKLRQLQPSEANVVAVVLAAGAAGTEGAAGSGSAAGITLLRQAAGTST